MEIYTQKENSICDRKAAFLPKSKRAKSIPIMKAVYFDIIYAENLTGKNHVNYLMKTFRQSLQLIMLRR